MRRMLTLLMAVLLLCTACPALAEDVCTVKDASAAENVTTDCAYLQVRCPIEGESRVTLTVTDAWGTLIYQRDHGLCSGTFRSSDIYLPLDDAPSASYTVTVTAGERVHTFRVKRERSRLTDTGVYAAGLTLREMFEGNRRKQAVILDMAEMNDPHHPGTLDAPLIAGGMQVGWAHIAVAGSEITVETELTVEGSIDKVRIYIAPDALTARTLGGSHFAGMQVKQGKAADVGDTPYAAVMVQCTVSYDETTAQAWEKDQEAHADQLENWQQMMQATPNDANG